jgi:hypothetical protein
MRGLWMMIVVGGMVSLSLHPTKAAAQSKQECLKRCEEEFKACKANPQNPEQSCRWARNICEEEGHCDR